MFANEEISFLIEESIHNMQDELTWKSIPCEQIAIGSTKFQPTVLYYVLFEPVLLDTF